MSINRKTVTVGVATLAFVGLTGGGIAWATTDAPTSASISSSSFHCAGGYGMAYGRHSPMSAVADYLGVTRAELTKRMRSGASLADIAQAQGKTVAGVKTAMVFAMKRSLAADSDLTPKQRSELLSTMKTHLDAMVNGTGMGGMDADDMSAMMGGSGMMDGFGGGMMGGAGNGSTGFGNGMMRD